MSRASGYFVVLVAVWMPNLVYNILSIQYRVNSGFTDLEDVVEIVTASQVNLSLTNVFRPDIHFKSCQGTLECVGLYWIAPPYSALVLV